MSIGLGVLCIGIVLIADGHIGKDERRCRLQQRIWTLEDANEFERSVSFWIEQTPVSAGMVSAATNMATAMQSLTRGVNVGFGGSTALHKCDACDGMHSAHGAKVLHGVMTPNEQRLQHIDARVDKVLEQAQRDLAYAKRVVDHFMPD